MEIGVKTVVVSSRFRVVIPREVRESMDLRPGSRLQVFLYENRIELIPLKNLKDLRGFIKDIDTEVKRDEDHVNQIQVSKEST